MSAWIVGKDHIDLMVSAALRMVGWNPKYVNVAETADLLGQRLWEENHRSINHRYNEGEETPEYHWTPVAELDEGAELRGEVLVQVVHNAHCYEYQSCEHPGWKDS